MKETNLNKVLNYIKQYVENKYEHDSEPMLNYKDLQLVLNEIDRLNNIIKELEEFLKSEYRNYSEQDVDSEIGIILDKLKELKEEGKINEEK